MPANRTDPVTALGNSAPRSASDKRIEPCSKTRPHRVPRLFECGNCGDLFSSDSNAEICPSSWCKGKMKEVPARRVICILSANPKMAASIHSYGTHQLTYDIEPYEQEI